MLSRVGLKKTFLIWSFVNGFVLFLAFLMVKERPRKSQKHLPPRDIKWLDTAMFKNPVFWSVCVSVGVTVL